MATPPTLRPTTVDALCDAIAAGGRLRLRGGGSKDAIGAPTPEATVVDMTAFAGVIDYDPPELVLTVGAGTPLAAVQALVAAQDQALAFDPFDHGPIFGQPAGAATIGGTVAAGVTGSRRLSRGAARDHLLGFRGVSGRGEAFVAGARVVKNVTGYDLSKLMCGSWGRLVALTEVTLKVLPAPRESLTLVIAGEDAAAAWQTMARALGSPAEVAAAAYLPGAPALTLLRLDGVGPSIAARRATLATLLAGKTLRDAPTEEHDALWAGLRTLDRLDATLPVWRIVVPARAAGRVVAMLDAAAGNWLADWGGGLIWAATACRAETLRDTVAAAGGHATLVRAPEELRASVPAFMPQPAGVAALEERVRRAFDPAGVFETGRF